MPFCLDPVAIEIAYRPAVDGKVEGGEVIREILLRASGELFKGVAVAFRCRTLNIDQWNQKGSLIGGAASSISRGFSSCSSQKHNLLSPDIAPPEDISVGNSNKFLPPAGGEWTIWLGHLVGSRIGQRGGE